MRFEGAKEVVFGQGLDVIIFVESQMVKSYEELFQLINQKPSKNKDALKVVLVSVVAGR